MLYYLNVSDKTELNQVKPTNLAAIGWSEKDLERLLARHIDRIVREDQLFVIHQERQYQEEPDIMAVDRSGTVHIFELKRWISASENLLQVLRYGQKFGQYDYQALNHLFRTYVTRIGSSGPKHLVSAHQEYFELDEPLQTSDFNASQSFVLVTDGLDRETRDAISYWSAHGLPVTALTYQVYQTTNGDMLFEVRPYGPEDDGFMDFADGLSIVNTNVTYMPDAWREMLDHSKAAAYYGRKTSVARIAKNTPIALYHTGVGIIAIGKTTGDFQRAPCGNDPDEEYFVPCEFEKTIDPVSEASLAVSAREINDYLGSSHRFRQTVYTLPQEAIGFIRKRLGKPPGQRD